MESVQKCHVNNPTLSGTFSWWGLCSKTRGVSLVFKRSPSRVFPTANFFATVISWCGDDDDDGGDGDDGEGDNDGDDDDDDGDDDYDGV